MASWKAHPAELRERAVKMVFELRAEPSNQQYAGIACPGGRSGWATIPRLCVTEWRAAEMSDHDELHRDMAGITRAVPARLERRAGHRRYRLDDRAALSTNAPSQGVEGYSRAGSELFGSNHLRRVSTIGRPASRKDWVTTLSPGETSRQACTIPLDSLRMRSSVCVR